MASKVFYKRLLNNVTFACQCNIICNKKVLTCLVATFENGDNLSEVSEPQEELSLSCSEFPNFLAARGDGGGGLRLQTCD